MPHMLFIIEPVGQREERGLEDGQAAYQRMLDFTDELRDAGVLMTSSALSSAATRLQRHRALLHLIRPVPCLVLSKQTCSAVENRAARSSCG